MNPTLETAGRLGGRTMPNRWIRELFAVGQNSSNSASLARGTSSKRRRDHPDGWSRLRLDLTSQCSFSISLGFECESVRLSQPLDHRLERSEHRSGHTDDGSDRNADRPSRSLRPIGHRQTRHQPPNHLPALDQQLPCCRMQRLERNLEITRYQPPRRIPPGCISNRAPFRPYPEMTNRLGSTFTRSVRLDGCRESQRQRLRIRLPVQRDNIARRSL